MKTLAVAISLTAVVSACSVDRTLEPSIPVAPPSPAAPSPVPPSPVPPSGPIAGLLAFVSTREGAPHIYLANPDGTEIRRLTNGTQSEFTPAWSPDGSRLAFNSDDWETYVVNRDGSGAIHIPMGGSWPSWSPDGRSLLVGTNDGFRIVAADGSGGNKEELIHIDRTPFGASAEEPWAGKWSPDGKSIAFAAWVPGPDFTRAFVMNSDGKNARTFFRGPGNFIWEECGPVWSPDGSQIALLSMVHGIAIVDMATGTATPILNSGTTCWDGNYNRVAWSPDGKMLAITKRDPPWIQGQPTPAQTSSIVIVDLPTKATRTVIRDAYDPAWTRDE